MTAQSMLKELKALGSESTAKTLKRHGAQDPCYGVKVGDLQKIRKRIKTDYQLALDLYDSGVYDAMYLAGLIADDAKMTKANLRKWAKQAYGGSLAGSIVPWVATGSPHGPALAQEWIDSKDERIAALGWSTLTSIMSVVPDDELDLAMLKKQLRHVARVIHKSPNCVREAMNGFVIGTGCHVVPLHELALELAEKIGEVSVDHGDTACKTPFAPDYIRKVAGMDRVGKKKKTAKC
jgi:3-methyladenine DNA glycosylase AlkD